MNKDLTEGEPQKVLWQYCLPLFGSIIFQQLYNIADSYVAGNYIDENALGAVGNSYEVTLLFLAFAFGLNIGCSVLTSRYFGAKDYSSMKTAVSTSMISGGIVCLALMLTGYLGCDMLLSAIHTPAVLFADSKAYLSIYILGLPFVFFYNISTGIFAALGDSKTPFYFLAFSSVANISVDIYFVKALNLGVPGIAIATVLCQGVSCVLAVIFVFVRLAKIKTQSRPKLFSGDILKQFLSIAVPSILQQSFISIGNIIIQGVINDFGPGVISGYSAGVKLNNLVITSFTTLGNGISSFASQNLGAKKKERIRLGHKAGLKMVFALSLPLCALYVTLPQYLLRFFMEEPSALSLESGSFFLRILAPFYFVVSAKLITDGILRGAGLMKQFMIGTFADLILRVVLAMLLSKTALGYVGIWCAWPIGWTIATIISIYFYEKAFPKSCDLSYVNHL